MEFCLRRWKQGDAPSMAAYANNPKVAANLRDAMPSPYTLSDAEDYLNLCLNADESKTLVRAIEINGEAVGSIGIFVGSDVYRKTGELGYWLGEKYWGSGVMTEAVQQLCAEAFKTLDINRIYAEPFARNKGSRRVLEKNGFVLEGVARQGVYKNGEYCDWCMYGKLRDEA